MSSHHFVRENQEPALLILEDSATVSVVEELLEWSPVVLVYENALDAVLRWGIKIDVVLTTQGNEQTVSEKIKDQLPVKILTLNAGEDPLTVAFYFLRASGNPAVTIMGSSPAQVNDRGLSLDVVVIKDSIRWTHIRSGLLEKWLPEKTQLFLFPESGTIQKTNLDAQDYVLKEGLVTLKSPTPFWLGEHV